MISAIFITSASNITVNGNAIRAEKTGLGSAAIDLGVQIGNIVFLPQVVNISDNTIHSEFWYGIRASNFGVSVYSRKIVIADNVITMRAYAPSYEPINAVLAAVQRTTIAGNVIDHRGGFQQLIPTGPAISTAGSCNTISGNTVEMSPQSSSVAILMTDAQSACTGNAIGLDPNYGGGAAISVGGSSNTVVSNTCGTVPPVFDSGALNEVAHNT